MHGNIRERVPEISVNKKQVTIIAQLEKEFLKMKEAVEKLERSNGFSHLDQVFGTNGKRYSPKLYKIYPKTQECTGK